MAGIADKYSPRKRSLPPVEYEDLSNIESPENNAKVHGVVTSLSPIKPNAKRPYFHGYISNGSTKMRFVGFNSAKEKLIEDHSKQKEPVVLSNCSIKSSRFADGLELIIGDNTTVTKSPVTFDITLDQLHDQPMYQKVSVNAKVIDMNSCTTLDDGHIVQNIIVSDSTSTAKVALWQNFVGLVKLDKSYKFDNLFAKRTNDGNILFTPKEGASIDNIDDLMGTKALVDSKPYSRKLDNAKIIAVTSLSSRYACMSCHTPGQDTHTWKVFKLSNYSTNGQLPLSSFSFTFYQGQYIYLQIGGIN